MDQFAEVPVFNRSGIIGYMKVDLEDLELANSRKWYLNMKKYASYGEGSVRLKTYRKIFFHRLVINVPNDLCVDHINRDTLDNRKINLRVVTSVQNQMNKRGYKNRSSRYKGVTWGKEAKKWEVRVMLKGKQHFVGRFNDELDAAKAYNDRARDLFGEFAYQNEVI